ncbi:MAG: hypothetical protein ABJC04_07845 [Verrucomicrobiota bacterium]
MNEEKQLKLQAHLDGELSGREAHQISAWFAQDREAQALMAELRLVKTAMESNEMELKLPESREFFWSKIERQIQHEAKQSAPEIKAGWWKLRNFRLAGGFVGACALLMISFVAFNNPTKTFMPIEVESPGNEMSAITFHSNSDRMTVVYLVDREPTAAPDHEFGIDQP